MKVQLIDWAGNDVYPGQLFDSNEAAWDFLTEDQHKRHPEATEKEFNEIMGEFYTKEVKDVLQRIIDRKEGDTIEVCLTVNGEETSFSTIIERLRESAQQWAWDRAREIYEERAGELGERLRKLAVLADKLETDFKCEVSKILPESLTDEDYR